MGGHKKRFMGLKLDLIARMSENDKWVLVVNYRSEGSPFFKCKHILDGGTVSKGSFYLRLDQISDLDIGIIFSNN